MFHDQVGFILGIQRSYNITNKNHMVMSMDSESIFDKAQDFFMIKALKKLETEEAYLNIIKAIYKKPIAATLY